MDIYKYNFNEDDVDEFDEFEEYFGLSEDTDDDEPEELNFG